jgi:hypothetical protein
MPFSPKTYQRLWIASLLVTLLLAAWTGISAAGGDRLGLSPQTMAWMGILSRCAGHAAGVLAPAPEDAISKRTGRPTGPTGPAFDARRPPVRPSPGHARLSYPDASQSGPSFSETITPPRTSDPHELPVVWAGTGSTSATS